MNRAHLEIICATLMAVVHQVVDIVVLNHSPHEALSRVVEDVVFDRAKAAVGIRIELHRRHNDVDEAGVDFSSEKLAQC